MRARRGFVLFALVLGTAALVASVTAPREERPRKRPSEGSAKPQRPSKPVLGPPAPSSRQLALVLEPRRGGRPVLREVTSGTHVVLSVRVKGPGQVELEGLGLVQPAAPTTPAIFDVFARASGRYRAVFTPAGQARREKLLGTLVVKPR